MKIPNESDPVRILTIPIDAQPSVDPPPPPKPAHPAVSNKQNATSKEEKKLTEKETEDVAEEARHPQRHVDARAAQQGQRHDLDPRDAAGPFGGEHFGPAIGDPRTQIFAAARLFRFGKPGRHHEPLWLLPTLPCQKPHRRARKNQGADHRRDRIARKTKDRRALRPTRCCSGRGPGSLRRP